MSVNKTKNLTKQGLRRAISLFVLFSMLLVSLSLVSCQTGLSISENEKTTPSNIEYGFTEETGCVSPPGRTAYKSDKNILSIDNAKLTFYYGSCWALNSDGTIYKDVESMSCPYFYLYFKNDDGDKYTIRRVDEEWMSVDYLINYKVDRWIDEDGNECYKNSYEYLHSEEITIPRELFTKETGYIIFDVETDHYPGSLLLSVKSCCIYYKLDGDYVILSDKEFE